jgi:alkylation response protein AidB-like acyl-CoA dehydrogenase
LQDLAASAARRDAEGGTAKAERDLIRASGLLRLSIPAELGGQAVPWATTLDVVRRIAAVDSSLGHVFGFHHLLLATVQLFAQPRQWQPWLRDTAAHDWFWGNALNPLDKRTVVQAGSQGRTFHGHKSFCSGSADADFLIASAVDESTQRLLIAALPATRAGITVHGDWNNMGQRQTDSGSVTFEQVLIHDNELLLDPGPLSTPRSCLRPLLAQLIFCQMFLGLAEGAFEAARDFTLNQSRPWLKSGVEQARQDPYILAHYGDFWVGLQGLRALVTHATRLFDAAWQRGDTLTAGERGEVAVAVAAAKVAGSRTGLDISSRLFEVSGARATQAALRLDRFWRNLRTQTLHDPLDYKLKELGEWALNEQLPAPSFYS